VNRPEDKIQRAVIEHLRVRGVRDLFYFHCPNGGARRKTEAAIMRGLGVRAGVPDLIMVHQGKVFAMELRALELEQDYHVAHALLARCFHFRFSRGGLREVDRSAAIRHARAAMATDDATTLAIAAIVLWFDEHDVTTAFELFDRALEIANSNVVALCNSAFVLAWMGQGETAIERARRALRLSPIDTLNAYLAIAVAEYQAGHFEEAKDAARRAVEASPEFSVPHILLAVAFVRLRRLDEAKLEAEYVLALDPAFTMDRWSATVGVVPAVFEAFAEAWLEICR